jgi:hypothetical protein
MIGDAEDHREACWLYLCAVFADPPARDGVLREYAAAVERTTPFQFWKLPA